MFTPSKTYEVRKLTEQVRELRQLQGSPEEAAKLDEYAARMEKIAARLIDLCAPGAPPADFTCNPHTGVIRYRGGRTEQVAPPLPERPRIPEFFTPEKGNDHV